jgi:hypothetical protein
MVIGGARPKKQKTNKNPTADTAYSFLDIRHQGVSQGIPSLIDVEFMKMPELIKITSHIFNRGYGGGVKFAGKEAIAMSPLPCHEVVHVFAKRVKPGRELKPGSGGPRAPRTVMQHYYSGKREVMVASVPDPLKREDTDPRTFFGATYNPPMTQAP